MAKTSLDLIIQFWTRTCLDLFSFGRSYLGDEEGDRVRTAGDQNPGSCLLYLDPWPG